MPRPLPQRRRPPVHRVGQEHRHPAAGGPLPEGGVGQRRLVGPITQVAGILYTIPSLALFQVLVALTGLTVTTVEIALVSYTLFILYRNIVAGLRAVPADVLRTDFMPYRSPRWFVVVDARGRVAWTHTGDEETSLLVLASRSTPLPYLAHLRQKRISYLLAGVRRVDLVSALAKIRTRLGAECLVSEAGGGLNGALLRAGLVDELHIVTIPALIGGLGTPSIMDGPPLGPGALPEQLRTIDVQVGSHGTIWAHYEVVARCSGH